MYLAWEAKLRANLISKKSPLTDCSLPWVLSPRLHREKPLIGGALQNPTIITFNHLNSPTVLHPIITQDWAQIFKDVSALAHETVLLRVSSFLTRRGSGFTAEPEALVLIRPVSSSVRLYKVQTEPAALSLADGFTAVTSDPDDAAGFTGACQCTGIFMKPTYKTPTELPRLVNQRAQCEELTGGNHAHKSVGTELWGSSLVINQYFKFYFESLIHEKAGSPHGCLFLFHALLTPNAWRYLKTCEKGQDSFTVKSAHDLLCVCVSESNSSAWRSRSIQCIEERCWSMNDTNRHLAHSDICERVLMSSTAALQLHIS